MGSDDTQQPSRVRGSRILRSVRFKIVLLLLVPLVALSTLWAFTTNITLRDGLNLLHAKNVQNDLGSPAGALGSALEQERRLTLVFLGSRSSGDRAAMESGRLATDRQAGQFRSLAGRPNTAKYLTPQTKGWTRQVLDYLDGLPDTRQSFDSGKTSRSEAFTRYTGAVTIVNALQASLATLDDAEMTKDAQTQVALARAREALSQEDGLLSGAIASGTLTFTEHVQFTKLVGTREMLYANALPDLRPADRAFYQRITTTPEYARLQALEDRFTDHMPSMGGAMRGMPPMAGMPMDTKPLAGTRDDWKTTVSSVLTRLRGLELSSATSATKRAKPVTTSIILRVTLAGVLGLVVIIATLILSLYVGRSVIQELNGLRRTALDLANERLPDVIRRLRSGEDVDVAAEAPPLGFRTEEINQVGQAFNAARRTAIQGAVEEAKLRRSIGEVFLNLARRNQALLHRQLSLLDTMERRISEPDELEDLFRLDHLATRMRRHAEGLIILSGQAPGRGWRNPVPVVDVARAAAAEVEDYARVTVTAMPRIAIAGPAVADLIHLLAELIENATLFSPPDTTVQVTGQTVGHGFAVEVDDRGLSMDPESLAYANARLADPPDFDLSNSAQLGLFVVSRLAQRHSVQVTLRKSPYGGTTAIVLVPDAVVVRGGEQPVLESGNRLAMTRRGEDALIPVGAIGVIGPPAYGNGNADTGPIPLTQGQRPPLPQRRVELEPAAYDATPQESDAAPYGTPSYGDSGPYDASPRDVDSYDSGRSNTDTGQWSLPATPADDGGRPPLPRRHGEESGGNAPLPKRIPESSAEEPPALPRRLGADDNELPSRHHTAPESAPRRSIFEPTDKAETTETTDAFVTERPAPPETAPRETATDEPGPGDDADRPSLPRRVRQASLAPQLRTEVELVDHAGDGERSPEELRTMLSSIQKGWLRGRSDAERTTADHKEEDI